MTKKPIVTLPLLGILILVGGSQAFAADTHSRRGTPPPTAETRSYVSESEYSSGGPTFSLGFSTGSLGASSPLLGTHSLAALIGLRSGDMIDLRFAIGATSPFNFGLGGIYKHSISQHGSAGFHIGGGFGLGDVNLGALTGGGNFALAFAGIFGFHFNLPGVSAISVHFDGGPEFTLVTSSPSQTNFLINALSGILGMSIYYTF